MRFDELSRRVAGCNVVRTRLELQHVRDDLVPTRSLEKVDLAVRLLVLFLYVHNVGQEHGDERNARTLGLLKKGPVASESPSWLVMT